MNTYWVSICALLYVAIVAVLGQEESGEKARFIPLRMSEGNFLRHQRFAPLFASEKRAEEFNDPRMFSTAFGKRSAAFDDPRFFSTAYGR